MRRILEEYQLFVVAAVAVLSLGVLAVWQSKREASAWEQYRVQHKCTVTAIQAETIMFTSDGGHVVSPLRRGWTCDGGITYWK